MIGSPFGNLLDSHLKRKGLTPGELAKKASISPSYVSLLISGKKGGPSKKIIEQLAHALELTKDEKLEFRAAAEESKADDSPKKSVQQLLNWPPEEAGIIAVHPSLSDSLLREYFLKANNLVRIHDSWLQDVFFTYNSLFRDMLKIERPDLAIEILLLNPESDVARSRERALNMPENYIHQQIDNATEFFKGIHREFGSKYKHMEMRLFDVLPSVQHIAFDETIFIGFYSHTARSQLTYQLQLKRTSAFGKFFEADFQKVWNKPDTTKINLELP